ncbi:MAG: hypothetical protein Q6351_007735 [Candidatus Njordarchaeum guaymaensis]
MSKKRKIPKCPKCTRLDYTGEHHIAMKRLYIKDKGKWLAIGWICPKCGKIKITRKFPIKLLSYPEFFRGDSIPDTIPNYKDENGIPSNYQG